MITKKLSQLVSIKWLLSDQWLSQTIITLISQNWPSQISRNSNVTGRKYHCRVTRLKHFLCHWENWKKLKFMCRDTHTQPIHTLYAHTFEIFSWINLKIMCQQEKLIRSHHYFGDKHTFEGAKNFCHKNVHNSKTLNSIFSKLVFSQSQTSKLYDSRWNQAFETIFFQNIHNILLLNLLAFCCQMYCFLFWNINLLRDMDLCDWSWSRSSDS